MTRAKVVLLGASGFAGAELLRRLLRHPHAEVIRVGAKDHVGQNVAAAHPNLEGATSLVFQDLPAAEAIAGADIVMMGLPVTASLEVVAAAEQSGARIIDMSGAFRVPDATEFERYYGSSHPRPELLGQFVYGLPELNRAQIRRARWVASPGCFATTIELALLPLAEAGVLEGSVEVVGITGSSGAGAVPTVTTHHPVRAGNLRTYKPLEHPHTPEIMAALAAAGGRLRSLSFVPVSAPLSRGIFATSFVRVPAAIGEQELWGLYEARYGKEPFVRVPRGRLPEVVAVSGSPRAEVGLAVGPPEGETRLVTVFSALDNLIKGGAGQAVQNLNLMLGVDETTTLDDFGQFP
ncbi:MAG: N-acetyl-gamma-glutamyl-phosphate reductase [Polyangiaceae bacterium]|jgi:N-acetyl-gamma-glutamyl-phosphate reductase|nr:N-acetyl-gamma-glutamyl-phosphate reductase [Polyangiaceae bacterium]